MWLSEDKIMDALKSAHSRVQWLALPSAAISWIGNDQEWADGHYYLCAGRFAAAVSTSISAVKSVLTVDEDGTSMLFDSICDRSASRCCKLLTPPAVIWCCCCCSLLLEPNNTALQAIPAPCDDVDDASLRSPTRLPQLLSVFFISDEEDDWGWLSTCIFDRSFSPLRRRLYRSSWHSWLSGNLTQYQQ